MIRHRTRTRTCTRTQWLLSLKRSFIRPFILLRLASATGFYCSKAVFLSLLGLFNRQRADRCIRAWARSLLEILHVDCQVFNPHAVNTESIKKPIIVMVNHSSLYDIPLSFEAVKGSLRMLAKEELFRIPLFGRAMRCANMVTISRARGKQALNDLKQAQETMKSGIILWIAPEGTRTQEGRLKPLKRGGFILAIRTGAVVIPVGIRGADKICPSGGWKVQTNQSVELHIGQPIDASGYTPEQEENLRQCVSQALTDLAGLSQPQMRG